MVWVGTERRLPLKSDHASSLILRELKTPSHQELTDLYTSLAEPVLTPFQTPEFLHAFQETHCGSGEAALSLICFSAAEGTGAPFMLLPLVRYRRGPLRVIGTPDFGLADQNAPVLDAGGSALAGGTLSAAIRAFFAGLDDVDLVDMKKLHEHVGCLGNPLFAQPESVQESKTLWLDLQKGNTEQSWRRKSIYKKLRSKFRQLAEKGVVFTEASTPEERLALFSTLAAQRKDRFRQLGREDSLQRSERTAFYQCLAMDTAGSAPFTALALRQGQEVVAAMVLMRTGAQATAVLVSIGDVRWHGFSAGMVLFAKAIEWAADNGIRWFAFGTGEQDYKQRFGGQGKETRRLLMPLSTRGQLFVRVREAHRTAQELLQIAVGRNT